MFYFAHIQNGVVTQVICADQQFIDTLPNASEWVSTGQPIASGKNKVGGGHTYDSTRRRFTARRPFPSWTLNAGTNEWEPPTPKPAGDGRHYWDEELQAWLNPDDLAVQQAMGDASDALR